MSFDLKILPFAAVIEAGDVAASLGVLAWALANAGIKLRLDQPVTGWLDTMPPSHLRPQSIHSSCRRERGEVEVTIEVVAAAVAAAAAADAVVVVVVVVTGEEAAANSTIKATAAIGVMTIHVTHAEVDTRGAITEVATAEAGDPVATTKATAEDTVTAAAAEVVVAEVDIIPPVTRGGGIEAAGQQQKRCSGWCCTVHRVKLSSL